MNVNEELQKLHDITGLDVAPDDYTGVNESYIVYVYDEERPSFWADDKILVDEATISVELFTPPKSNYMDLKHKIRDYLETIGKVVGIDSFIDTYSSRNNLEVTIRCTVFTVTITKWR